MISEKHAEGAVAELGAIPYFPRDEGAHTAVMRALCAFVGEPWHLRWLVDTANNHMREWRGIAELRALYCTRFKPADGREEYCNLPGYTPDECEMAAIQESIKRPLLREPSEVAALANVKRLK